ncbi:MULTISPECIES: hypothetical protein [Corynebacterium]|uniref:hypothetical protein n=1 Tax=Corynebacterium TaxID=1716 RepID=UPI0021A9687A|nr:MULTISPECIES: hypothetical protein [Corynebacterium]MCT1428638.1 hypothetical protein [Corynebacterium sp. p3-SID1241]WKE57472.1 hypothetical protein J8247_00625 [Corynebacterium tuberculostearicum]WKE58973.1 hypothetical protein KAH61_08150 [Corynebacterium tuberculostearicum]
MGARRTSRLIASAVAVATFSSITAVPSAVAADDTTFVEERTTDDTVSLNGIEFDEDGNLLEENNAGDKAMEELDAEEDAAESITPYAVDGAEETAEAPASEDATSAETTPSESAEETSTEEISAEEAATEEPTSEESTEPSTTEAAVVPGQDGVDGKDGENGCDGINGKDGKDADMSSVAGFSFLAALVGGGTVLGILSTIDYFYTHGMLPKNSVPWRINQ